ncbi:hypothetical protein ASD64_02580 [Mesorhizobium sp. Root157]|uniref:hypothetical protein n=1 Tax=Mesorhizobium sp. Root157 TaxID=1736477 RepID=UPI000700713E|nr:hypothetical protein [Mesorhizobium sp. Root157]KQZ93821.1 hypothetical protein ASD64_02580 [Mesorhizobium sp. Root157]
MEANNASTTVRSRDHRAGRAPPAAARSIFKREAGRRKGCGDVAWNRAARYARHRRIRRSLWPLIAATFLIILIFERRPFPAFSWTEGEVAPDGGGMPLASMPDEDVEIDRLPDPEDAGDTAGGIREPSYQPPAEFLATGKEAAQIVAFLIRNRGRLDNEAVRAKWAILDRFSLPLAIFLREIEATAGWDDLEKEISAAPFGTPDVSGMDIPSSMRHRKILRLAPEWAKRGEDLMTGGRAADPSPGNVPIPDADDSPDTRPRKP